MITATMVETHKWCHYSKPRGFVLTQDEVRLPFMITVDLNDVATSLETALRYGCDEKHDIIHKLVDGKYVFDRYQEQILANKDEVRAAVLEALK